MLEKSLLSIEVTETEKDREYWATRVWVNANTQQVIRSCDILIAPWEGFRDIPAVFPQGSAEFIREISADLANFNVSLGVDAELYQEVALHADRMRWPTLLVTAIALPVLAQIIANRLDKIIPENRGADDKIVEVKIIAEGDRGKCIAIEYKGPPGQLVEELIKRTEQCLPRIAKQPRRKVP